MEILHAVVDDILCRIYTAGPKDTATEPVANFVFSKREYYYDTFHCQHSTSVTCWRPVAFLKLACQTNLPELLRLTTDAMVDDPRKHPSSTTDDTQELTDLPSHVLVKLLQAALDRLASK